MSEENQKARRITLTLSWKLLCVVLTVLLAGLVVYTRPWESQKSSQDRKITVSGEAVIKRAPDLFLFYPYYEAKTQEEVVNVTNEAIRRLKEMGLGDAGIQTSISNYEDYGRDGPTGEWVYTSSLTLTVDDKEVAQKVQDYLVESKAAGSISPSYDFTRDTKKQLKDEAAILAIEDARRRADSQANSLGVKLGQVVNVTEPEDFQVYPVGMYDSTTLERGSSASLLIQAGENEFTYTVKVEFEIH